MRLNRLTALLITLILLAAAGIFGSWIQPAYGQSPVAAPGATSRIAFVSTRDGHSQIYSMNPDGSDQTNLSRNRFNDTQPGWSPDGKQIVFVSDRDGNNEICLMVADGSNPKCLTNNATPNKKPNKSLPEDRAPSWSPDGRQIAFVSTRDGNIRAQVYLMNVDGSNPFQVTNNNLNHDQLAWSPDSHLIAFASDRNGNPGVCLMDASGFNERCLTNNRTANKKPSLTVPSDFKPAWAPDNLRISFTSTRDRNPEVYVMGIDGADPQNLSKKIAADDQSTWAPDGSALIFVSNREGRNLLYRMNADGSNQARLTNPPRGEDTFPVWSPGGLQGTMTPTATWTPTPAVTFTAIPTDVSTVTPIPPIIVPSTFTPHPTLTSTAAPRPTVTAPPPASATRVVSPTPIPTFIIPSITPSITLTPDPCTIVTNKNDAGPGSLRFVIACAPPGSTVTFLNTLSGTINLTTGTISFGKDLNILGPGAGIITVSGTNSSNIFDITDGIVKISGLTFTQGTAPRGGAIEYCPVNAASSTAVTLTLAQVHVTGNVADFAGGGVDSCGSGSLIIDNAIFDNNSLIGGDGAFGGAISSSGGLLSITGGTQIINNSALASVGNGTGGGIYSASSMSINVATISSNKSNTGGGIYFSSSVGSFNITAAHINANTANTDFGGGLYVDGGGIISTSQIDSNSAISGGGGIYYAGGPSTLTIDRTTVSRNSIGSATGTGAGIQNQNTVNGVLDMENSTLALNRISSGNGGRGGALFAAGQSITNVRFTSLVFNAVSGDGGNVYAELNSSINMFGSIVAYGTASSTAVNILGGINSLDYNLFSDITGLVLTGATAHILINTDPILNPFGTYTGSTLEIAPPRGGSPAINRIPTSAGCVPTDERGVTRPVGPSCDMGAIEYNGVPPVPTQLAPTVTSLPPSPTLTKTATAVPTSSSTPSVIATASATNTLTPTFTATATASLTATPLIGKTITRGPISPPMQD